MILAGLCAVAGFSAPAAGSPEKTVGKVAVLVDGRQAGPEILAMVPIASGDRFSLAAVNQTVQRLYKTGIFSDIKVSRTGEEQVGLSFELTRNLVVKRLRFRGFPVRRAILVEAMTVLRQGEILAEAEQKKATAELEEELRRRGFFGALVRSEIIRDQENGADIVFMVSNWKKYKVASLAIQGEPVLPETRIKKKLGVREGRTYVPLMMEHGIQSISAYYSSQGYRRADIRVADERFDERSGTVAIDLRIAPNEKIIITTNGAKVPAKILAPIWEERVFEEWGLAEGEARILNYLRKKGYLFAEVSSRLEKSGGELGVVYDIDRGRKYSIENIIIEGAKSYSPEKIKAQLAAAERSLFFSLVSLDRLFALPGDVETFYRERGFSGVTAVLELERKEKTVVARLKIDEGQALKVEKLIIQGASAIPAEEIKKELGLAEGGPFVASSIQRDAERIENLYLRRGFRGTVVSLRTEETGPVGRAVLFDVKEGRPFAISNVYIIGNRHTKQSVIRKELQLKAGDKADFSLIRDSERRLDRLGIFSDVQLEEVAVSETGETLLVKVREGEQNSSSVGVGFQSGEEVRSPALWTNTFRPRGTAEYIRSNVFGLAAQFSVLGQYGQYEKRFVTSWSQPYLFGLALQPTVLGWYEAEDRVSYAYERSGASLNTIMFLRSNFSLITTLRWTRTKLTKLEIEESEIDRQLRPYSTALASLSFIWDYRDDLFNPEKGIFFSIVGEVASPLFGTESDYVKTFFKFQWFKPVVPRVNLSITSRLGLGWGEISIPERFFAGGGSSFRGEPFDYLGPRDSVTDKPIGGRAIILSNVELKFPLIPAMRELSGVAFVDVGNLYASPSDIRLDDLETAVGTGIRYRTPLGPIRLEIAWKLWDAERRTKPLLFVTLGNVF